MEAGLILLQRQQLIFQVTAVCRTGQHRTLLGFIIEIWLCLKRLRRLYLAPANQLSAKAFHCLWCAQCKPCTEQRFPTAIFVQDCLQALSAGPVGLGLFRGEDRIIGQFQPPFPDVLNAVPVCKMGKQPIQIGIHLLRNRQLSELHIQPDHQSLIHQLIQMLLFLIKRVFFACGKVPAIRTDTDKPEPDLMLENTELVHNEAAVQQMCFSKRKNLFPERLITFLLCNIHDSDILFLCWACSRFFLQNTAYKFLNLRNLPQIICLAFFFTPLLWCFSGVLLKIPVKRFQICKPVAQRQPQQRCIALQHILLGMTQPDSN